MCPLSGSLPFKMSNLLSLLHRDTVEHFKSDFCLSNRRDFLGQSGVTPATPTFSPTGMRKMEKFIPQFIPIAKKTTHSLPQCSVANTIFRRNRKKIIRSKMGKAKPLKLKNARSRNTAAPIHPTEDWGPKQNPPDPKASF